MQKILALFIAALFAGVLSQSVYLKFEKIRIELANNQKPARDGSVQISFPAPPSKEVNILLLTIANGESSSQQIRVALNNDDRTAEVTVPPNASKTFWLDASGALDLKNENRVSLFGTDAHWSIQKLEIRNLYGSLKTLVTYVIVPRDGPEHERRPPIFSGIILFLILGFFGIYGEQKFSVSGMGFPFLARSLLIAFFCLVLSAPVFVKYKLLLSIETYMIFTFAFYFSALRRSYGKFYELADRVRAGGGRIFQSGLVLVGAFAFYSMSMLHSLSLYGGNYSGFARISQHFALRNPFLDRRPDVLQKLKLDPGYGYDAQFFYNMTFDPFLKHFSENPRRYRRMVDSPPFRYRRIGFPLLIKTFSGNNPALYPKTMVLLILFFCLPSVFFLMKIAEFYGKDSSWALLYILIPAFSLSLQFALPEGIAAAFLLAAFYFYLIKRMKLSAGLFAFCLLIRETSSLAILALALFELFKNKNRKSAFILLTSMIPYFAWRSFITWRLVPAYGWKGFFFEPPNFTFPYAGIIELFGNLGKGEWHGVYLVGAIVFPVILTSILLIAFLVLLKRLDFLPLVTFVYALLGVSLRYEAVWKAIMNPERQTFECFVFFVLLFFSLRDPRRPLKLAFAAIFLALLIYNWNFLTVSSAFRAGLYMG